jgi:glucosyl-3-phosphoglycerate synthase
MIDELIVIDGNSTDNTINILNDLKKEYKLLDVVCEKDILKHYQCKKGKGNQLWKGLYYSKGDIILYCDSDIKNFNIRMIYGLIGPLICNEIKFVKGFYERPLILNDQNQTNEGGRVTELCARPIINMFYPELSGFVQPLSGEYGGYRNILENVEYMTGYGVEVNILIEVYNKYGIKLMGQVDLLKREHKHQNTNALSKMSFTIMNTVLRKNKDLNLNSNILTKNMNTNNNIYQDPKNHIHEYFILMNDAKDDVLPSIKNFRKKNSCQSVGELKD